MASRGKSGFGEKIEELLKYLQLQKPDHEAGCVLQRHKIQLLGAFLLRCLHGGSVSGRHGSGSLVHYDVLFRGGLTL
jgi:hypothetical protein